MPSGRRRLWLFQGIVADPFQVFAPNYPLKIFPENRSPIRHSPIFYDKSGAPSFRRQLIQTIRQKAEAKFLDFAREKRLQFSGGFFKLSTRQRVRKRKRR
jgi:hypothetical protein